MPGLESGSKRRVLGLVLANLGLLALFAWALTETTSLRIEVVDGLCTAVLNQRTNTIPCPGVEQGQVGIYSTTAGDQPAIVRNPWRQLIPDASWRALSLNQPERSGGVQLLPAAQLADATAQSGQWRTAAGELQPLSEQATLQWINPLPGDFVLEGQLRRPAGHAGLLLLRSGDNDGWLFLYNETARLGTWWRWQAGQPAEPLFGAPFQKSLTSQVQSLLRLILLGHHAGLLLLLAVWLLAQVLGLAARRRRQAPAWTAERTTATRRNSAFPAQNRQRAIMTILLLWTFGWSLFIAGDLLGGIPHVQDSITYRFQAQTLARGHLTAPAPSEPAAFEQEFLLVGEGRWFGKYPPGYPALLAIGELLGLAWLVNPLLATLTTALLFLLGRCWYGQRVGLLAAFLATVSPFFLIMSATYMAHAAELFWVVTFMVAWTMVVRQPARPSRMRWLWLLGAGLSLGMIVLTRQLTAVALAGPFILASTLVRPGDISWSQRFKDLLVLALAAAPLALLLLIYQAALTGDPFQDPRLLFWSYDHLGFGQDIGQGQNVVTFDTVRDERILIWQYDPDQPLRGHSLARGVFNVERNWRHLHSHLFGWLPPLTLAFAWLVFVLGQARRADWIFLASSLSLISIYIFYWADGISYGPRYFYAALPAFLLLVARGIQTAATSTGRRSGRWAVGLLVALFVAGGLTIYFPTVLQALDRYNFVNRATVAAVEAVIEGPALVLVPEVNGDWWEYGTFFTANTPWLDGRIIYARDLGPASRGRLQAYYPDRDLFLWRGDHLQQLSSAVP
jgi:4-amino-4-deoxy-L-arabinose transferase-like glycosyltransferase